MKYNEPPGNNQLILPFSAKLGELLATIKLLENAECGLTRRRMRGVIELLQRLAVLAKVTTEPTVAVRVSIGRLANGIHQRATVHERTIQLWARDAISLGLIERDIRSAKKGRANFNDWKLHLAAIHSLAYGRKISVMGERFAPRWVKDLRPYMGEKFSPPLPIEEPIKPTTSNEVEEELISHGVSKATASRLAPAVVERSAGDSAKALAEVKQAFSISSHPRNRELFRSSVAATVCFLRNGEWPAEGVVDPAQVAERVAASSDFLNAQQLAGVKREARQDHRDREWIVREACRRGVPRVYVEANT